MVEKAGAVWPSNKAGVDPPLAETSTVVACRTSNALLTSQDLCTSAGELFLDRYTQLLHLNEGKQLAMCSVLVQYLERVEFDESRLPEQFLPFERSPQNSGRHVIALSLFVSFARPVLRRTGVTTRAVVQRLEAGEAVAEVRADYGLEESELEEAILYEAAA